ncbi:MAG TPA: PLP-dependent aminotransferase family protein [Vicinamibacterales bacterium]|nr:PLP-dependent aminotransferase family protein [Vicinamibacterales bacterium]
MAIHRTGDLLIRLDRRAGSALQRQIYSEIRRAVLDGVVQPGARLPSSRALADDLAVSRTTTLLAFEQLTAEGYLVGRHGSGTFVAHELPDDLPRINGARQRLTSVKHPPLSRRGLALTSTPPPARRMPGPPRAFRLGAPAVDLFPLRLWSQLINRRLRSLTLAQLDYNEPGGFRPLREAIADHVQSARGTRCRADEVLIVGGTQRGLELICDLVLDVDDEAWLEEPGYPGARAAMVGAGARIVPVPVDEEGLSVVVGARLAGRARLVYVTPSNQFPLGVPMSLPRRLALLRWAGAARAWVLEDDYDSEFRYGARPIPCLHGLDEDGRVIYVGSFSKTLFPALRLGFLIVPSDLQRRLVSARRAADVHPPLLEQAALADLMSEGHFDRHLRRMRAAYRERLDALTDAAARHCGGALALRPVRTGLHAVADLMSVDAERVHQAAAARGVEVTPLAHYYLGRPRSMMADARSTNAIVLGFGSVRPDALRRGMEQLASAIEAAERPEASGAHVRRRAGGGR